MSASPPAIRVRDLAFGYTEDAPVLRDISLEIPANAVTALLGPNGSGKTTLLYLALGLLQPAAGRVEVGGRRLDPRHRREISRLMALVPQDEHLTFNLSVLEYVLLGRAPYLGLLERPDEADREAAWDALERVGIPHLWERSVTTLSGGEKQMAVLARALAQGPDILVFDEPTSHLDVSNTRQVIRVIDQLRRANKTVVLTTHAPNIAAAVADHVVLLRRGEVLASGPAADILTAPLLTAAYDVEIEVARVEGRLVVLDIVSERVES